MSRRRVIVIAAVSGVLLAVPLLTSSSARSLHQHSVKDVSKKDLVRQDRQLEEQDRFKQLEAYVAAALNAWEPYSTLQESIANDIVRTTLDPGEPALFVGDIKHVKTAMLLASVESHEGHGFSYVDKGLCNDPAQRSNPILNNGDCDGGKAYSLFQIHPGIGIVLFDQGGYGYHRDLSAERQRTTDGGGPRPKPPLSRDANPPVVPCRAAEELRGCVIDADALRDRRIAVKTALHMLRASLKRDGTLCEYSGETKPCPKAEKRLKKAVEYVESHPYP